MARPLLLVDSDLFILLSAAGVLGEFAASLGLALADVRRLDALPHQLRRGKRFAEKYPQDVRSSVLRDCDRTQAVTDRPENDDFLQALADTPGIDVGEALLLATAAERPVYLLASGDKRALRLVGARPELRAIRDALAGRILCLETALNALARRIGLPAVARAFTPVRALNITLRVVFAAGESTQPDHFKEAVDSYLLDLEEDVGAGFLMHPEDGNNG